jgi:formamidopyrimidine-DNA glycosylase
MPELPEVEAALELLRSGAKGRTITSVQLLHPSLQRRLSPSQLDALSGARIVRVERRGKHQLLHLDDGRVLHAHFRMNGDWAFLATGEPLPRFARAVIDLDDGRSLIFLDSRMLGTIDLHPAGVELDLGLGPDAADPDWTAAHLEAALAIRRGPIKPALLDQRLVAGLGNIYAAESLWRARISPFAACDALSSAQVSALRAAIAEVIARATGSRYTDDDTVDLDVYDREGLPCRRCRTPVARVTQAGRSTFYCPHCQPAALIEPSLASKRAVGASKASKKSAKAKTATTAKRAKTAKSATSRKTAKTATTAKSARVATSSRTTKATKPSGKASAAKRTPARKTSSARGETSRKRAR